jgi:hypothetical protein
VLAHPAFFYFWTSIFPLTPLYKPLYLAVHAISCCPRFFLPKNGRSCRSKSQLNTIFFKLSSKEILALAEF